MECKLGNTRKNTNVDLENVNIKINGKTHSQTNWIIQLEKRLEALEAVSIQEDLDVPPDKADDPRIDELRRGIATHNEHMSDLHHRLDAQEVSTGNLLKQVSKQDNTEKAQNTKVSKELAELKAALETHISTVVKKDEARLAEQHKLEGLLTSHRSDLDKKQAALETHILTVIQKNGVRLAEQRELESLLTSHRSDLDKNQAKLQTTLETHISTVVKKDETRLAEQRKLEGLLTSPRSDLNKMDSAVSPWTNPVDPRFSPPEIMELLKKMNKHIRRLYEGRTL